MKKYIVVALSLLLMLAWLTIDSRKASPPPLPANNEGAGNATPQQTLSADEVFQRLQQDLQSGPVIPLVQLKERVQAYKQLRQALVSMPPDKAVVLSVMMTEATLNTVIHAIYNGSEQEVSDTCAVMEDIQTFLPNDSYPALSLASQLGYTDVPEVSPTLVDIELYLASSLEASRYMDANLGEAFLTQLQLFNKDKGLQDDYFSRQKSATWALIYSDPAYLQLLALSPRVRPWVDYYLHCTYRQARLAGSSAGWFAVGKENPLVFPFYMVESDLRRELIETLPERLPEIRLKSYYFEKVK